MTNRFSLLIIVLLLFSCGSTIKENFNINIIKTKEYLKNKNQIEFFVNNPSNYNITNLEFKINNKSVSSPYTLDDKLGKNILKASFYIDDKQFTINKEFIVYSSVKPKVYTYKILNEFFHDMNSYTQGLEFDDDFLYEGTGQYGYSMLKKINFQTPDPNSAKPNTGGKRSALTRLRRLAGRRISLAGSGKRTPPL